MAESNPNQTSISNYTLDDLLQSTSLGSINKAIGNNIYGLNHRQVPTAIPYNKETYGFTFFVKPQLNLQSNNIRNIRLMYNLLTNNSLSIPAVVRCELDTRITNLYNDGTPAFNCPLVDPKQAFIPVLTNDILSISGWPDMALNTFTSREGLYKESYSQIDDISVNYSAYTIDAMFRNNKGDHIFYLFYIWLHYMSNVFQGKLLPYPDFLTENEIDYNTRIYRLILDINKDTVTKIAAANVAFPITNPTGQFFDYNIEKPYNDQNKEINIRFQCLGFETMDSILIEEFNKTVEIFNPDMKDEFRNSSMIKLSKMNSIYFNNRGYPRINPNDYKLEWWIDQNYFKQRSGIFLRENIITKIEQDNENTGD